MGKRLCCLCLAIATCLLSSCTSKSPCPHLSTFAKIGNDVNFGRDFYGLQSQYWNVKNSNSYPMVDMASGNLDNTFGSQLTKVDSTLSTLQPKFHRVHIINTTCIRNGNCGNYEIGYGYNKASFDAAIKAHSPKILNYLTNRVSLYKALFSKYPGTTPIISPALEHDLSVQSWSILADTVLSTWPGVQLANSPDAGVPVSTYRGAWIERHTNNFPLDADIVSLDGTDITDIDVEAYRHRVMNAPNMKIALSWTSGDNCRVKQWIDPRQRKNCPSATTFELVSHITEPLPGVPPFTAPQCRKTLPFKAPDIWKPLAESYSVPDPRAELPVLITGAFQTKDVNLISANGKSVGVLGFYGSFGKQFRWYSGYKKGSHLSGYQFQKKALALSGSPYIWIEQNGQCRGPLAPGRRAGDFR